MLCTVGECFKGKETEEKINMAISFKSVPAELRNRDFKFIGGFAALSKESVEKIVRYYMKEHKITFRKGWSIELIFQYRDNNYLIYNAYLVKDKKGK
jgi:hypothetical protein